MDLDAFFATTYIEKVKGTWDTSNNLYLFSCYKDGWSLFHLHHVCVRGGQDGVVTGLNSVENDWSLYSQGENNFKISAKDWDNTQGVAMGHALKSVRIDESDVARTILIKDGTIFANCYQQSSNTANPAHWMMKLGTLYEIAHCKAKDSSKSMFRNNWPVPMKQLYLHQCANPSETNWKWGQNMYGLVSNQMVESGLLDLKFIFYNDDGYEPRSVKGERFELTCFEDIYASTRVGVWMQQFDVLIKFRRDAAKVYGEPSEALSHPEIADEMGAWGAGDRSEYGEQTRIQNEDVLIENFEEKKRQSYCLSDGKSAARIKIFQRSATNSLRKFININEVVRLAQDYTTERVEIVSVNASTSIAEQIRFFNEFDLLITPHGSHLANGIFTVRPQNKAVIEIVPYAFDKVFYSNYIPALGFAHYIISTGHLTPSQRNTGGDRCVFKSANTFDELSCKKIPHAYPGKYPQKMMECPTRYHTRMCDTFVQIPLLKMELDTLFNKVLCGKEQGVK